MRQSNLCFVQGLEECLDAATLVSRRLTELGLCPRAKCVQIDAFPLRPGHSYGLGESGIIVPGEIVHEAVAHRVRRTDDVKNLGAASLGRPRRDDVTPD